MGGAAPTGPNFQQGPTAQVQPPNYMGAAQNNYNQQNQNYENTLKGAFGIPTALAGGWAGSAAGSAALSSMLPALMAI
jgi:hypothetical protein